MMTEEKIDCMVGKKFGKLTVLKITTSYKNKRTRRKRYICLCDCGEETVATGTRLRRGLTFQCRLCGYRSRKQSKERRSNLERYYNLAIKPAENTRNIPVKLSIGDFGEIIKKDCFYCGSKPRKLTWMDNNHIVKRGEFFANGVDRIDPSGPYSKDNCVACCSTCNYMKSRLSINDFLDHIKKIYEFNGGLDDRFKG